MKNTTVRIIILFCVTRFHKTEFRWVRAKHLGPFQLETYFTSWESATLSLDLRRRYAKFWDSKLSFMSTSNVYTPKCIFDLGQVVPGPYCLCAINSPSLRFDLDSVYRTSSIRAILQRRAFSSSYRRLHNSITRYLNLIRLEQCTNQLLTTSCLIEIL